MFLLHSGESKSFFYLCLSSAENAFAFVYQELTANPQTPNVHHPSMSPVSVLKRKYLNGNIYANKRFFLH
jgi:hypothetical protein